MNDDNAGLFLNGLLLVAILFLGYSFISHNIEQNKRHQRVSENSRLYYKVNYSKTPVSPITKLKYQRVFGK